jgi:hypothetical protein
MKDANAKVHMKLNDTQRQLWLKEVNYDKDLLMVGISQEEVKEELKRVSEEVRGSKL